MSRWLQTDDDWWSGDGGEAAACQISRRERERDVAAAARVGGEPGECVRGRGLLRWAGLRLDASVWAEWCVRPKCGNFPRETSQLKTGTGNLVGKTPQSIPLPVSLIFPGFFPFSCFSCENDIWTGNVVYGAGRDGIFPFPLSSLVGALCTWYHRAVKHLSQTMMITTLTQRQMSSIT
jgi:hypothetical protein